MRNSVAAAEQRPAEPVKDTEKLPILSKTVDLGYLDPIRRGNLKPALPGKITSPVTIPEGLTPAEKANPESIQEALQLQALMDFKKQRALQKVRDAQERAAIQAQSATNSQKSEQLKELVELYISEQITYEEYYSRLRSILGKPVTASNPK